MTDDWKPLKKFLEDVYSHREWVSIHTPNYALSAYLRRTSHYFGDRKFSTIDVANINVSPQRSGGCSTLLTILESLIQFEAVFVEGVLNEHLAAHLLKRGYTRMGNEYQPNYVKFTNPNTQQEDHHA
jgi:hypothetical protein